MHVSLTHVILLIVVLFSFFFECMRTLLTDHDSIMVDSVWTDPTNLNWTGDCFQQLSKKFCLCLSKIKNHLSLTENEVETGSAGSAGHYLETLYCTSWKGLDPPGISLNGLERLLFKALTQLSAGHRRMLSFKVMDNLGSKRQK